MKVLVTGSTGLVGEALVEALKVKNHHVTRLVRRRRGSGDAEIVWDPAKNQLNAKDLEGFDAVIHLAGANIAGGRWTPEYKQVLRDSRVVSTKLLSEAFAKLDNPPKSFISASAVGYYGNRKNEKLTEVSDSGKGFLPALCRDWEAATEPAKKLGIRVINYRLGIVLSRYGGALKAMYWPFRLGVAGNLSLCGKQHMSWITLQDAVGGLIHCLENEQIAGPVNATAPNPVDNATFTATLRKELIPAILPMHYWTPPAPGPAVELLLGEMGKELLLADIEALPVRLTETGYIFKSQTLKQALTAVL